MPTALNAPLMPSVTVTVRSSGLFWLKHVTIVLPRPCSAMPAEWPPLKPCCVEMYAMLSVMRGSSVFPSASAITERSEIGLHDVPTFMSPFDLGIGMMPAKLHA